MAARAHRHTVAGMAVLSAQDVPAAEREDYWRQVLSDSLVPAEVTLARGPGPRDRVVTGRLGAVRVTASSSGPGELWRTRRHVTATDDRLVQVLVPTAGRTLGRQGGREALLRPGDLVVADAAKPFRCRHGSFAAVTLTFDRRLLGVRAADLDRVTGTTIRPGEGSAGLVSRVVQDLPHQLGQLTDAGAARLGTTVVDLVAGMVAERVGGPGVRAGSARDTPLLARVLAHIEEHLADPDLSPATVAAAHHVSVRQLHRLFEGRDETVAARIRARRLERCRRDLLDPALAGQTVAAIGARWGLPNPSQLSRLFRQVYGVTPSELRRTAGWP